MLSHLIFTEALTRDGVRFIVDYCAKYPGQRVYCYTSDAKASQKHQALLPSSVVLHIYDKREQAFDNTQNAYVIGRHMTQAMADAVESFCPDFFQVPGYPYRFNHLYQFAIQRTIARHKLNFFYNAMRTMGEQPDASVVFLDQPYLFEPSWQVLRKTFPILARQNCTFAQTGRWPENTTRIKLKALGQTWKYRLKHLQKQFGAKPETGGVLTFARCRHHLAMLEPTLQVLSEEHKVSILDYFPKSFKAENPDFYESYTGLDPDKFRALDPRAYAPTIDFMGDIHRHLEGVVSRIIKADCPDAEKQFYWDQFEQYQGVIKQVLRLESIVRTLKPEVISACMEADSFGLIFQELRKVYGFKTVNVLHGMTPYFQTSDFFSFNAFFVWNQQTYDVLSKDGYPGDGTLKLVGNPFWKEAANIAECDLDQGKIDELLAWKGEQPLIVAYSQPETNYTTPKQRREFFETLLQYLQNNANVKLLVKKHPNEFDTLPDDLLEAAVASDRVRLYKSKELPLYSSISIADLAVSICSAVLVEALYYRIPALALDYEGVNESLGNGLDKITPVVSKAGDAEQRISEILRQGMSHPAFSSEYRNYMYPTFSTPYQGRIREELASIGAMSTVGTEKSGDFESESRVTEAIV